MVNPNTRYDSYVIKLDITNEKVYKQILKYQVNTLKLLFIFIIINIGILINILIASEFNINLIISQAIAFIINLLCLIFSKYLYMKGYNKNQINSAIYGDEYSIAEVNVELFIAFIDNLNYILGRTDIIYKLLISSISIINIISILIYIIL